MIFSNALAWWKNMRMAGEIFIEIEMRGVTAL